MRVCARCSAQNADDVDFCTGCGEYLRWDPTGMHAAVPAPVKAAETAEEGGQAPPAAPGQPLVKQPASSGAAPPAQPPRQPTVRPPAIEPDAVVLTVRLPSEEGAGGPRVAAACEPGGQAVVLALVRNQSGIVDNYDLTVEGLPAEWVTVTPPTVYLVPFGSPGGTYEQEVEIRIRPPRAPEAEARPWEFTIVATSRTSGAQASTAHGTLTIGPYYELESEMRPERRSGRRKADFAIAVRNKANAPVDIALAAHDSESACTFSFAKDTVHADPGRRAGAPFTVRPPKQIIIGRPVERRFEVNASAIGAEAATFPKSGVYKQLPWLPWWLLLLIPLIAVAGFLFWQSRPNETEVPNLVGQSGIQVEALLRDAGLTKGSVEEKPTAEGKPGRVVAQDPTAGEKVEKDSAVSLVIAVGTGKVKVPNVVGMSLEEADKALDTAKLTRGDVSPADESIRGDAIVTQVPDADTLKAEGSAVNLFFAKQEPEQTQTDSSTDGATTGPDGGDGGPAGPVAATPGFVPDVVGHPVDEATQAVTESKLKPSTSEVHSDKPIGTVVDSQPPDGTALPDGTPVTLFVSNGYPLVAFDAGDNIVVAGGAHGEKATAVADSEDLEQHPAWNPKGTLLAYRRGQADSTQIWVVNPSDPNSAHPITDEGHVDRRPAISPDGLVVAFVRAPEHPPEDEANANYDLCFKRIGSGTRVPACKPNKDYTMSRPAWSPDGRSILVAARRLSDPKKQTELFMYTTRKPNSSQPSQWVEQGVVTGSFHGDRLGEAVASAQYSPDGSQVAFSANWGTNVYRLWLAPVKNGRLQKPKSVPKVRACELSWLEDGSELMVAQDGTDCLDKTEIVRVDLKTLEQNPIAKTGSYDPAWSQAPPPPPEG